MTLLKNKLLQIFYGITAIPVLFFFFNFFCFSSNNNEQVSMAQKSNDYGVRAVKIPENLEIAGQKVPINRFDVRESLDRELHVNTFWHSNTILCMKRAHRYFPIIEPILKKHNLPDDMKYIAVAESALTEAVSPAGAQGIWQFMKATGESYDLEINADVDERDNIEKATEAACKYLKDSYKRYKDWALVLASYNAGSGRINSELASQKADSYYDLHLNSETARYVYRIIALKLIISDPAAYGFNLSEEDLYKPLYKKRLKVDTTINNLIDFAHQNCVSYKMLKLVNPWLRSRTLPNKSRKIYYIDIPIDENHTLDFKPVKSTSDTMQIEKEIKK